MSDLIDGESTIAKILTWTVFLPLSLFALIPIRSAPGSPYNLGMALLGGFTYLAIPVFVIALIAQRWWIAVASIYVFFGQSIVGNHLMATGQMADQPGNRPRMEARRTTPPSIPSSPPNIPGDWMQHVNIAAGTTASPEVLNELSSSPESVVRMQVALNPNAHSFTLYRLTGDPDAEVAAEAISQLSKRENSSSPDQLDQARVGFFDLEAGERPIETAGVNAWAGWPVMTANPIPIRPEPASELRNIGAGFTEVDLFPFPSVLLLTYSRVRWCPHRSYKGNLVFEPAMDRLLAGDTAPDPSAIYGRWPHPMLGNQSIRVSDIQFASIDAFDVGEMALLTVHLVDKSASPRAEYPWPDYDMHRVSQFGQLQILADDPDWGDRPRIQFTVHGFGSLNFAISMNRGFDHLEIPVRTESLNDVEREHWEEFTTKPTETEWAPLFDRLSK